QNLITNTQRRAAIARRRLNKDSLEWRVQKDLAIHRRVVSNSAGQAQISETGFIMQVIKKMESNFFQPQLQARRQVALSISQLRIRLACRAKLAHILVRKNSSDLRRAIIPGHIDAFRRVAKIIQTESKLPFLFSPNDVAKLSDEPRPPER